MLYWPVLHYNPWVRTSLHIIAGTGQGVEAQRQDVKAKAARKTGVVGQRSIQLIEPAKITSGYSKNRAEAIPYLLKIL